MAKAGGAERASDARTSRLAQLGLDGAGCLVSRVFARGGGSERRCHEQQGEFSIPHVIALDAKDNIYAGDIIGKRVQKFLRK
jgi:hypothetical protein